MYDYKFSIHHHQPQQQPLYSTIQPSPPHPPSHTHNLQPKPWPPPPPPIHIINQPSNHKIKPHKSPPDPKVHPPPIKPILPLSQELIRNRIRTVLTIPDRIRVHQPARHRPQIVPQI